MKKDDKYLASPEIFFAPPSRLCWTGYSPGKDTITKLNSSSSTAMLLKSVNEAHCVIKDLCQALRRESRGLGNGFTKAFLVGNRSK